MKILHTSDWHLGRALETRPRINEQKLFLEEMAAICDDEQIELVLVAGDVFDSFNPPAEAEELFFDGVKKLSTGGLRPVVIIAGNHDSPERLRAPSPLAEGQGIILVPSLDTKVKLGSFNGYEIVSSGEGYFEMNIRGEKVLLACLPYPNEKRLNRILSERFSEKEIQRDYSEKIGEILSSLAENFREDTINIVMGHFYILGGETCASERELTLGGAVAVNAADLPKTARYFAMGHLHRPQKIHSLPHAYYSGSPLQYSRSEIAYQKSVCIVEASCGKDPYVTLRPLTNHKPIEVWRVNSAEEIFERYEKLPRKNIYVYLEITTDRVLEKSELRRIRSLDIDIADIILNVSDKNEALSEESVSEKSIEEEFIDFYRNRKNAAPSDELLRLFASLAQMNEEEGDE